jgi:hypothetical protein
VVPYSQTSCIFHVAEISLLALPVDSFMASVSKLKLAAPPSSLGFIIHALELLNAYPPPKALQKMLNSTESDLLIVKVSLPGC